MQSVSAILLVTWSLWTLPTLCMSGMLRHQCPCEGALAGASPDATSAPKGAGKCCQHSHPKPTPKPCSSGHAHKHEHDEHSHEHPHNHSHDHPHKHSIEWHARESHHDHKVEPETTWFGDCGHESDCSKDPCSGTKTTSMRADAEKFLQSYPPCTIPFDLSNELVALHSMRVYMHSTWIESRSQIPIHASDLPLLI